MKESREPLLSKSDKDEKAEIKTSIPTNNLASQALTKAMAEKYLSPYLNAREHVNLRVVSRFFYENKMTIPDVKKLKGFVLRATYKMNELSPNLLKDFATKLNSIVAQCNLLKDLNNLEQLNNLNALFNQLQQYAKEYIPKWTNNTATQQSCYSSDRRSCRLPTRQELRTHGMLSCFWIPISLPAGVLSGNLCALSASIWIPFIGSICLTTYIEKSFAKKNLITALSSIFSDFNSAKNILHQAIEVHPATKNLEKNEMKVK